jgi:hypothetical protein
LEDPIEEYYIQSKRKNLPESVRENDLPESVREAEKRITEAQQWMDAETASTQPTIRSSEPVLSDDSLTAIELARRNGMDYTPRERKSDFLSLREALQDALRQTPATLYVGEVRDRDDWKEVLEFAGSGHLVVTTAHAGSLQETMEKIFSAVKANTPQRRRYVVQKLLGVVHVRAFDAMCGDEPKRALLPCLWRRTESGVAALISDGLASVLPNTPQEQGSHASFGRFWCLSQLWAMQHPKPLSEDRNTGANESAKAAAEKGCDSLQSKALILDIQGE